MARSVSLCIVAASALFACSAQTSSAPIDEQAPAALTQQSSSSANTHAAVSVFARLDAIPAGIAADRRVVFVGSPLAGRVLALSRPGAQPIGELPPPPNGFALPFIMHSLGEGRVAVLDAGGLPSPSPFMPANPTIYEYTYTLSHAGTLSARLVRSISFASAFIGFAEDFVALPGGRYLLSDAVLGSIWIAEADGNIVPGIVPKTFEPQDAIPQLALCPTMPLATVNGLPFLFSGSTLPGVSPLAVRDGKVYFFSPCARGTFSVPLASLFDHRPSYQRAADIRLVGSTPASYVAEELLDFSFNPFDASDPYLYAADPMQLQIIRQHSRTGAREIIAHAPRLLDFPSSLAFVPPANGDTKRGESIELLVVSNQQERTPLTNDAIAADAFNLPFLVTTVVLPPH